MVYNFHGRKINIWMQLTGFDREQPDCGAALYIERTGFIPESINALVFHSDIVHLHRGMTTEYVLFPDICSYYASPKNTERDSQPWTNHNLRTLARGLRKTGTNLYASIMGMTLDNAFHKEWIYDHPEIMYESRERAIGINVLKRFINGTFYEDFFIDKLCVMLTDYEFDGIQLADAFCPMNGVRYEGDFSSDMVEQFAAYSGIKTPDFILETLGDNSVKSKTARGDWLWHNYRSLWIRFYAWRWEQFFIKLCSRLHAIGKKVIILGHYCTDPFETLYCLGMDLKSVVRAGVDYIMPNILPTSVYMGWGVSGVKWPYYFHRYMSIAPLTVAYVPDGHFLGMQFLHDTSEEIDLLHHAPCKLERDLYTMTMYQLIEQNGSRPCMEGLMLCQGDGLSKYDWNWIAERIQIATSLSSTDAVGPVILWSDHEYYNMLDTYIKTRRWTTHKFVYEIFKCGVPCGSVLRCDQLANVGYTGPLFIPNIDLYADYEIHAIAAYKNAIVCTAPAVFVPELYGIKPCLTLTDQNSRYPMQIFVSGYTISESFIDELRALIVKDDGSPELNNNSEDTREFLYTLYDTLPFSKVSLGFMETLTAILKNISEDVNGIVCDVPAAIFKIDRDAYRLYLYCKNEEQYGHAFVRTKRKIVNVEIVTKYPVLPARFMNEVSYTFIHDYTKTQNENHAFKVNTPPGGVTIVDIFFSNFQKSEETE